MLWENVGLQEAQMVRKKGGGKEGDGWVSRSCCEGALWRQVPGKRGPEPIRYDGAKSRSLTTHGNFEKVGRSRGKAGTTLKASPRSPR